MVTDQSAVVEYFEYFGIIFEYLGEYDGVWAQVKAKLAAPLLRSPSAAIDRCRRRRRRRRH